ncbi:hypothetical protein MTP99_015808 [Tenebrio molitor]|nr:hypothetical protein MTP99_015808 [Tenebrio molitor]
MDVSDFLFVCLMSTLPGPPSISVNDAILQLYPIDKHKCHKIDPIRDIAFQLYTVHNPLMAQNLIIGDDKLLSESYFNFSQPTVIYFHAFFESSNVGSPVTLRTAYLQRGGYNLILLNAPRLEAGPWYLTAARNTQVVGEYTAKLIDYLVSRGMSLPSLHLIGLSLGAQMAGVCGQSVKSGRVVRITGLDPAGPLFKKWPKSLKLDSSDAEFVDVIHSDAGIFGYPTSVGHVDFWPNRGISPQPGCTKPEVKRTNPDNIVALFFCSHWRSYQFYAESVLNDRGFVSVPCDSWQEYLDGECRSYYPVSNMGFNVDFNAKGNYYLRTAAQSPYSLE